MKGTIEQIRYALECAEAVYVCVNKGEAYAPGEIMGRSFCINGDIGEVLQQL